MEAQRFDYQGHLLMIVEAILEDTPESRERVDQLLDAFPRQKPYTVGDYVWGRSGAGLVTRCFRRTRSMCRGYSAYSLEALTR